jgi:hypothetical protein
MKISASWAYLFSPPLHCLTSATRSRFKWPSAADANGASLLLAPNLQTVLASKSAFQSHEPFSATLAGNTCRAAGGLDPANPPQKSLRTCDVRHRARPPW